MSWPAGIVNAQPSLAFSAVTRCDLSQYDWSIVVFIFYAAASGLSLPFAGCMYLHLLARTDLLVWCTLSSLSSQPSLWLTPRAYGWANWTSSTSSPVERLALFLDQHPLPFLPPPQLTRQLPRHCVNNTLRMTPAILLVGLMSLWLCLCVCSIVSLMILCLLLW